MSIAGKTPAQPCMPAVVPKPATKLAVPWLTPRRVTRVSMVTGKQPALERDVKAKIKRAMLFLK